MSQECWRREARRRKRREGKQDTHGAIQQYPVYFPVRLGCKKGQICQPSLYQRPRPYQRSLADNYVPVQIRFQGDASPTIHLSTYHLHLGLLSLIANGGKGIHLYLSSAINRTRP